MEQKSKSPLALMEQAVMILIFAFAAALCVQVFQKADAISKDLETRDRATVISQTVAETVKALHGDFDLAAKRLGGKAEEKKLLLWYDSEWNAAHRENAVYELSLSCSETTKYLVKSELCIVKVDENKELFRLPVSWQKEVSDE